ncbi:MAG TPA: NAD(P)-dependent oxidoreductase [Pseudonocardiaceae bacterium]|jgi:nucleoside-diphosphate-sugar epimerase
MRIFLAGASGVLGNRLLPVLLAAGHEVVGLTRKAEGAEVIRAHGAEAVVGDVFDRAALAVAVRDAAPDLVMHQLTDLGSGDPGANARLRSVGTRNLVDAALAAGVGKIVAQSIAWMYAPGEEPATEDVPLDLAAPEPRAITVRGVADLESAVQEIPEWVILRYGLLYGPTTWYAPDGLLAQRARAGELTADADLTSFLHIDDAVTAAIAALDWRSGAVNVCDDEPAPGTDWLPVFCAGLGAPEPAQSNAARHGWARGADNRYARTKLDWTPQHPSWRTAFLNQQS